jgi:hypothetical protein
VSICGLVLTNVVVAVLLDEFIKAVQDEKQKLAEPALPAFVDPTAQRCRNKCRRHKHNESGVLRQVD